ncbi:MAG: hypothetical protein WDN69_34665 [Aliidongia sp.]
MTNPVSNTFKGTIKRVVEAPPYQIVTIALDPKSTPEITVAYIPVPGGPTVVAAADPTGVHALDATPAGGQGGKSGQVTVTIPVPNAVISPAN